MKIRLLSDLHMEGYRFNYEYCGEDVLVLAGDIHTRNRHDGILFQVPSNVRVILVAGNHEFYQSRVEDVLVYLTELELKYPNVVFLDNEYFDVGDVSFFGGTMFTDFKLMGDPSLASLAASGCINDFRYIWKADGFRWTTQDHLDGHKNFVYHLDEWLQRSAKKRVVVSHFVPSEHCIHPRFRGSMINPYFTSNMEAYMGFDGVWMYGHTHDSSDFHFGDTRVISNPRGYGNENPGFNPKLIVEV